jgi:hypothetical protein
MIARFKIAAVTLVAIAFAILGNGSVAALADPATAAVPDTSRLAISFRNQLTCELESRSG